MDASTAMACCSTAVKFSSGNSPCAKYQYNQTLNNSATVTQTIVQINASLTLTLWSPVCFRASISTAIMINTAMVKTVYKNGEPMGGMFIYNFLDGLKIVRQIFVKVSLRFCL